MTDFYTPPTCVTQGELASGYSQALAAQLSDPVAADLVAFLAWSQANGAAPGSMSTAQALTLKALVEAGSFSLSDLFAAAQSKTGAVDGAFMADPQPKLTVDGFVVDLAGMLAGQTTTTWQSGTGSKVVYHTREYFTATDLPSGWWAEWAALSPVEVQVNGLSVTLPVDSSDGDSIFLGAGYDFTGTITIRAEGDINWSNERVYVTLEDGTELMFNVDTGANGNPEGSANHVSQEFTVSFSSADGMLDLSWTATSPVKDYAITAELTYSYWM